MKTKILIVEDEGLIALDLQRTLEDAGYTALIAVNASDALLAVDSFHPCLVLMDIRLPGPQDGIETAEQIRLRFHVPVIFLTAHADLKTLDRARLTAPHGYIVKPFLGIDIHAQIEMALWKHRMRNLETILAGEEMLYQAIPSVEEFRRSVIRPGASA
jgi:DNA-binding response OmpR family regulator